MTLAKQHRRAIVRYERLLANAQNAPYPVMRIYSRVDQAWQALQSLRGSNV